MLQVVIGKKERETEAGRQTDRETELTIEIPGNLNLFIYLYFDTVISI